MASRQTAGRSAAGPAVVENSPSTIFVRTERWRESSNVIPAIVGGRSDALGPQLPEIVARFYDAAADPSEWSPVLREASAALGAEGAFLANHTPGRGSYHSSERLRALIASYFEEEWVARNPWPQRMASKGIMDSAVSEWILFSPEELSRQPIYNEWALKNGFAHFLSAVVANDDGLVSLDFVRTPDQGPFSQSEIDSFAKILPALRQAVGLAGRLAASRDAGAGDLIGQMTRGAALVDYRGRIVRINAAAERHLDGAIAVESGVLVARQAAAAAQLRCRLARVAATNLPNRLSKGNTAADGPIALPRPGTRPLLAEVVPLAGAVGDLFRRATAIVLLTDPDEWIAVEEDTCRRLFDLSPAEARLAIAVSRGEDIAGFAEAAGLAVDTVRKRIKNILAKTGTRRQAELSALLGRLRRDLTWGQPAN